MRASHRIIARLRETPRPGDSQRTGHMPDELLSEQVQRLAVFAAIAGSLWTFALLLDVTVLPAANGTGLWNWRTIPVEIAAAIISATLCVIFRQSSLSLRAKKNAGLTFMLLNAVGISALNAWGSVLPHRIHHLFQHPPAVSPALRARQEIDVQV